MTQRQFSIDLSHAGPLSSALEAILIRVFASCGHQACFASVPAPALAVTLEPSLPAASYAIQLDGPCVRVSGADAAGLLAGVGRHLHEALSADGSYEPGAWTGQSTPSCVFRGMYFAHNFHNWYREAPIADIKAYIEDLALWGLNAIAFPVGTNPVSPIADVESTVIPKQIELMRFARTLGISAGILTVANGILDVPEADIAATPVPDGNPPKRGNVGNRVCPSNPAGLAAISGNFSRVLNRYADAPIDFVVAFPYDEGGCGCPDCWPWGARGYVTVCKELSRLAKARHPECTMIAGTWCFDALGESEGEYSGFDAALRAEPGWCDMVMCDAHGAYPEWPKRHGAPGGLPMINFSEISMWGRWPWGGSGANPFPQRLAGIWNESQHLLAGGLPYSEGRFEDINKVTCLSLFWDRNAEALDIVRRYVRRYFSHTHADRIAEAILTLEATYPTPGPAKDAAVQKAHALLTAADSALPDAVRTSWRWRILLLRSIIDAEAARMGWTRAPVSEKQNEAYRELIGLYCAEKALSSLRPPAKA